MQNELTRPLSPERIYRTDSLVFSITDDKEYPPVEFVDDPQDTNLLDSNEDKISKEIINLNSKLSVLQGKVLSIKSQKKEDENKEDENRNDVNVSQIQPFKAGRICRKKSIKNSFISKGSKNNTFLNRTELSCDSRKSHNSVKQREFDRMKRQMIRVRMSAEKNERSKLRYSEELSESKKSCRKLKKKQEESQKISKNLKKQLQKSENIRKRQKQIILQQKEEILELKKLLKLQKIEKIR